MSLKLEQWQGPPHINKVKQYEIVLFYGQFVYLDKHSIKICLLWLKCL